MRERIGVLTVLTVAIVAVVAVGSPAAGGVEPGLVAKCTINRAASNVSIFVRACNNTGNTLLYVTPLPLRVVGTGSARIRLQTHGTTRVRRELVPHNCVTFKWQGKISGVGVLRVSEDPVAKDANGKRYATGEVRCPDVVLPAPTPTRTPVKLRPTRTPPPTSTPEPRAAFDVDGLVTTCELQESGNRVRAVLQVTNKTGINLKNLSPTLFTRTSEGASFRMITGPIPRTFALLKNGFSTTFQWSGDTRSLDSQDSFVAFRGRVFASVPSGGRVGSLLTQCGTIKFTPPPPPEFDRSKLFGRCVAKVTSTGSVSVSFDVINLTGATLTNLRPTPILIDDARNGIEIRALTGPYPSSFRDMSDRQRRRFKWRAVVTGNSPRFVHVRANAKGPGGGTASTGRVQCQLQR